MIVYFIISLSLMVMVLVPETSFGTSRVIFVVLADEKYWRLEEMPDLAS